MISLPIRAAKVDSWSIDSNPQGRELLFSLLLWSGVVICGRLQAHNWFE